MIRLAAFGFTLWLTLPIAAGLGVVVWTGAPHLAKVLAWPGLPRAALLSLGPGLAATGVSVLAVGLILAARPRSLRLLERLLAPLLALPHAAAALGLVFLISPSGWVARALSPRATGWTAPPDLMTVNDPMGLALTLGLILKEVPFLLLVALAPLQASAARDLQARQVVAATMGYGRVMRFALTVWPALYPQIRLPVLAVLTYSATTVDMGAILGPTLPHPLSVQVSRWMTEPGLTHQGMAAAGALVQLALVGGAVLIWRLVEASGARTLRHLAGAGLRGRGLDALLTPLAGALALLLALVPGLSLVSMLVWSVAGLWPFPDLLPQSLDLRVWKGAAGTLWQASLTTLGLALGATGLALGLTIAALQVEGARTRHLQERRMSGSPAQEWPAQEWPAQEWPAQEWPAQEWLVYPPLIIPQIAFLPGLATALIWLPVPPLMAVALAHLTFVLPYVFLGLAGPFRAWDGRMGAVAATLGTSPARVLLGLRLPMLAPAIAAAAAIGIAVSVGQYLPTLLLGGGRVTTLTTEAVALASGANRRTLGAYVTIQALWPALAFLLARRVRAVRPAP